MYKISIQVLRHPFWPRPPTPLIEGGQLKKKEKNCEELILEYMLMDLPLIVLIIESSFLHLNIV